MKIVSSKEFFTELNKQKKDFDKYMFDKSIK